MGEVYSPERVARHEVPEAGGQDQLEAAGFIMNRIRAFPLTSAHAGLIIPGSIATGQANRRSDVDYVLVDRSQGLPANRRLIQAEFIRDTFAHAERTFNVRLEGQRYTDPELAAMNTAIYDALWLAHALEVQDNHPDYAHGKPLEALRYLAIDLGGLQDPQRISMVGAISLRYMAGKAAVFSEAGEFNPSSRRDLLRFQRALEAPKALARKMLPISEIEGHEVIEPDVTSRQNMKQQMEKILERIDDSGRLNHYHDILVELDQEYDHILEETLLTGDIEAYGSWLRGNYLPACALAHQLAEACRDHIDRMTYDHPGMNFYYYGIDLEDEFDADFALQHSLGEPLVAGNGEPIAHERISRTYLYNEGVEEIDAFLDTVYGPPERRAWLRAAAPVIRPIPAAAI